MNRIELRAYARKIVRIDDGDVSDTDLDMFLDEGYDRIAMTMTWPWSMADVTEDIPLITDTNRYTTTGVVERITSVLNLEQRYQLRSTSKQHIDRMVGAEISASRPTMYYWSENTLVVFPTPTSTDTLRVHYISTPSFGGGDTDEPPFHKLFHRVIVDWALHRLWEMEEDFEKSAEYRGRYQEGLVQMASWYNDLMLDTPNIYGQAPTLHHPTNMPFLDDAAI